MRFSLSFALLAGLLLPGCGLFGPADDTRAPLIELTRPGDGSVVGGAALSFTGEARGDDNFISFITVSVDGERIGEAGSDYARCQPGLCVSSQLDCGSSDGKHRIQATAFDRETGV